MKFGRKDYNGRIVDTQNKIPQDEPVFLLRGQDELAPRLLLMWAMEVRLRGGDPNMASEAEAHAQEMINWQKTHKVKTPDMYQESDKKKLIKSRINELLSANTIDIKMLVDTVGRYFDTDGYSKVMILMPSDLNPESMTKEISDLGFNDFTFDQVTLEKAYDMSLIIYVARGNRFKILKNVI